MRQKKWGDMYFELMCDLMLIHNINKQKSFRFIKMNNPTSTKTSSKVTLQRKNNSKTK